MSATAPQLSPELEAIARRTAELVAAVKSPVLTLTEAIPYTKHESDSAFYRWAARWAVRPCAQGRYARRALDRALEKEATRRRPKAA